MTAAKPGATVQVDDQDGIVIRAPLDVSRAELVDAARRAHRLARLLREPNVRQRATMLGREAFDLRYGTWIVYRDEEEWRRIRGMKRDERGRLGWADVTEIMARRHDRDDLDERQVRRWAAHWRFATDADYDDSDYVPAPARYPPESLARDPEDTSR